MIFLSYVWANWKCESTTLSTILLVVAIVDVLVPILTYVNESCFIVCGHAQLAQAITWQWYALHNLYYADAWDDDIDLDATITMMTDYR